MSHNTEIDPATAAAIQAHAATLRALSHEQLVMLALALGHKLYEATSMVMDLRGFIVPAVDMGTEVAQSLGIAVDAIENAKGYEAIVSGGPTVGGRQ